MFKKTTELCEIETCKALEDKGTYTLVIFVPVEKRIAVGRMGALVFYDGYYVYTGSAFGKGSTSLKKRILRHLRAEKKNRWHVDHLLSEDGVEVVEVVAANTDNKMECKINRYLKDELRAEVPILGFGSSDCKEKCRSHLLYLGKDKNLVKKVAELYSEKIGTDIYIFSFR